MSRLQIFLQPNDLCDCFKPLLYIGNIFAYPYKIAGSKTLRISKTLTWLNFSMSVISLIMFDFQQFVLRNHTNIENAFQMFALARILTYNFLVIIYVIKNSVNHKSFVKIFTKFQKLESHYNLNKNDLMEIFKVSIFETIYSTVGLLVSAAYIFVQDASLISKILYGIGFTFLIYMVGITEFTFVNGIALTEKFVTVTHESLIKMSTLDYHKDYNFRTDKNNKLEIIKRMRCGYRQIFEIKNEINDLYSFQILSTIAYSFNEIVFVTFLTIVAFQLKAILSDARFIFFTFFTAYMVGKLAVIIVTCERLTSKLKKTGEIIYQLLAKPQERETEKELKLFASELLHRNPSISAQGFFNIDYTLAYNIIGAVFMYIIILLQFRLDEKNQEGVDQPNPVESLTYFGVI